MDQRVEQRVDAGHRRDARGADGAHEAVEIARIGNEHVEAAKHRKRQQVRRQREDVIERQRREHPLVLVPGGRPGPDQALQRVRDQIAMSEHRAFGHARRSSGVLQQRHRRRRRLGVRVSLARRAAAGVLQHGEFFEVPGRHGVADVGVREIERPALEDGHEIAEPRHHDVADLRLGDDRCQLVGEIFHDHDDHGAGIRKLLFELARRVQRIDVDDSEPRAQRAEKRDRIGEHVRQHDGDTVAWPAIRLFEEERRKIAAVTLPFGVAHSRAQAFECRSLGVMAARFQQHGVQRRIGVGIDALGDTRRVRGEPDGVHRPGGGGRGRNALRLQRHGV